MELTERTKKLIAVGASVAANCGPCLSYHADKAREGGIPNEEIAEAVEIGKRVRKGATSGMDKLALRLVEDSSRVESVSKETACCC